MVKVIVLFAALVLHAAIVGVVAGEYAKSARMTTVTNIENLTVINETDKTSELQEVPVWPNRGTEESGY